MTQSVTPINTKLIESLAQIILSLTDEERQQLGQTLESLDGASNLQHQREELQRELSIGVEQLKKGEYQEYDDTSLPNLLAAIKTRGQNRLRLETTP
jgi:hypothetical protein